MADPKATLRVIDALKSEVPSAKDITRAAKKKKKKKQGEMNKAREGEQLAPPPTKGVY
jgi:hypothetical protein